ncbi:MAG: TolC family protein [Chitinophagaceae bacterium]|nr:TolC family protein [Chitinophagaceae bacterium]
MGKLFCFLVVFATTMANRCANAQINTKWDLRSCVEFALTHNVSVRQADIQARLSAVMLKQSRMQQIPSLNLSANHGFSFGRSLDYSTNVYTDNNVMYEQLGLSTQVNIFNWNSLRNTIRSNDLNYQADMAAIDKAKNDVALNVARQYLLVLLDMEQAAVTDVQLKQSQAQYQNTRKQVDAGALPELNAAEMEAQVARDSANLIGARTQIELDKLVLKVLINLPADAIFDLEVPPVEQIPIDNILEISPVTVFELAMKSQPQIKVNSLRLMAAQRSYEAAKGKQYPSISLFGQLGSAFNSPFKSMSQVNLGDQLTPAYVLDGPDKLFVYSPVSGVVTNQKNFGQLWDGYGTQLKNNFGQGIGIGLSIPIFNNWSAKAGIERARWDIKSRELAMEQDSLQLKQDIYTAYNQALGSFHTFSARQKEVAIAERSFDLATKRFEIGAMQTIEWLTNQSNLYNARINKLIAQYDYVFKMKVLEFYKGQGIRL